MGEGPSPAAVADAGPLIHLVQSAGRTTGATMTRDPSLPPEPLPLTEASVQEIQLELIRRWRFNQFDGPKVVASLRAHRKLWRAVLMDRLGFISRDGHHWGLIKLRDLPGNTWNVDD